MGREDADAVAQEAALRADGVRVLTQTRRYSL